MDSSSFSAWFSFSRSLPELPFPLPALCMAMLRFSWVFLRRRNVNPVGEALANSVVHVESHEERVERYNLSPCPAGQHSFDVAPDKDGLLVCKCTLLAHIQLSSISNPKLFSDGLISMSFQSPYTYLGFLDPSATPCTCSR